MPSVGGGHAGPAYVASTEPGRVGGDFYDAITFRRQRAAGASGPSSGAGPQAAAVMGQLRSALGIFAARSRRRARPGPPRGLRGAPQEAMGDDGCALPGDLAPASCATRAPGIRRQLVIRRARAPIPWFCGRAARLARPRARRARPQAARSWSPATRDPQNDSAGGEAARRSTTRRAPSARHRGRAGASADALCDALLGAMGGRALGRRHRLLATTLDRPSATPLEVRPREARELGTPCGAGCPGWLRARGRRDRRRGDPRQQRAAANCVEHAYRGRDPGRSR